MQEKHPTRRVVLLSLVAVLVGGALGVVLGVRARPPARGAPSGASPPATPSPRPPATSPPSPGASPGPAPSLVPSASGGLRVGVSYADTLPGLTPEALASTLDDAVALGIGWLRLDLAWSDVQPQATGSYDWQAFDRIVTGARARHLSLLPVLAYTPAWARPDGCSSAKCAPADPDQFAAFAGAAARRYAPEGVHTWEIWNEPNSAGFWKPAPSAAGYGTLLVDAARAIRAGDPAAFLVSGGLAHVGSDRDDVAATDFLDALGASGALGSVNAVGYHPYSLPVPQLVTSASNAWDQIAGAQPSLQGVLSRYGLADTKIWVTECGAPTDGPGAGSDLSNYAENPNPDHVSENLQAVVANDALRFARSSTEITGLFWYSYRDLPGTNSSRENFFGLRRHDGSAKPAYAAFRNAIAARFP